MADDGVSCLSDLENPSAAASALGVFSIIVSTLVGIPQAYKIYRLRSARGVSFLTLGLGNVGGSLYVLNLVILHFNQITLSFSEDFWFWLKAQRSLTFVYVELFNTLSMMGIWPVAAYYVQDTACHLTFEPLGINWVFGMKRAVTYGALLQAFVILACWLPALMILSISGRCEPLMVYGNLLGIVVAILICTKFLPQLQASIYAKGSHSLSYVTYGFDACAGVVAWAQKVFITKERVSSWLPPLFLHVLEVTVLSLNFYHDTRRSKDEDDKRDSDNSGADYGGLEDTAASSSPLLATGQQGMMLEPRQLSGSFGSSPIAVNLAPGTLEGQEGGQPGSGRQQRTAFDKIIDVFL